MGGRVLTGVTAVVVHTDPGDGAETIRFSTGHEIQFGYGSGGDGFCYAHQSFGCVDNLTAAERAALHEADPGENPTYGPGNPDFDRDFDKTREDE